MSRAAWLLLLLLILSNGAWLLTWHGAEAPQPLFGEDTIALERQVDDLQAEVTRLRGSDPRLVGMGEDADAAAAAARTPPEAAVEGEADGGAAGEAAGREEAVERIARDKARREGYQAAKLAAEAMLRKVMQVEDPALRREGVAEIAAALAGDDPYLVEYTLAVLHSARDVAFDRSALVGLVEAHLGSENGGIRRSALYALAAVDPEHVDVDRILASAGDEDPRVRGHTARLLALTGGKTFEGRAAETVLGLLRDDDPGVRKGTLRGLAGAEMTPALEQRLVQMAAQGGERSDAVYFGLSQMPHKSRPVVDALLACLEDPDRNIRGRAHWGLQRGVAPEQQYHVAQQYADRLGRFLNPQSHREALKLIVRYGDDSLAPALERFAANELVDPQVRELARKAADYLTAKKPR